MAQESASCISLGGRGSSRAKGRSVGKCCPKAGGTRRRQDLLGTYLIDMNAVFLGMPNALFPAMAEHTWGTVSLGLLYAAPSFGSDADGARFAMDGEGAAGRRARC